VTKPKKRPRKFWKSVVTVTVLSEGDPITENWDLEDIRREIDCGDMVGEVEISSAYRITRKEVVKEIYEMGSNPSFFSLNDKGKDTF
jgi:hypothetical protein